MYKQNPLLVGDAINGTISVLEYAKKEKIKKVIFASSSSLYNGLQPPHNENMDIKVTDFYTEARLCIERIARLYNVIYDIRTAGLRFFSVYGPHEEAKGKYANIVTQFIWEMKKGNSPIIYGDGTQKRDFVFVKDVIKACLLLMNSEFEYDVFNVGTGKSYSFNEVANILNGKLNTNIKPTYIEMPIKNYVDHTLADIRKIRSLGYQPEYSFEKGIDELKR